MAELVTLALAAWRLAHMLVDESGPGAVFVRLRHRAGLRMMPVRNLDSSWSTVQVITTPVAELFTCVWCMSVWTAALLSWRPLRAVRGVLAVSAAAIIVQEVVQWLRSRSG